MGVRTPRCRDPWQSVLLSKQFVGLGPRSGKLACRISARSLAAARAKPVNKGALMNESTNPSHSHAFHPGLQPSAQYKGVRGWLLVLCLMLTVVGPAISTWLMANEYTNAAPLFSESLSVHVLVVGSLVFMACSVAFGAYAGLRLWLIRPNAVNTAKHALLFGLAADVITTTIEAATALVPSDRLLFQVEVSLVPSLIFFTLCFAYLNKSKRVYATYGPH